MLCAAFAFDLTPGDEARLRGFTSAVGRWQSDPEFRTVAKEYCVLGSGAMQSRPFYVSARGLIMAIRSTPGLPKEFAVSPTSRAHYEDFSRGPLSAYLHLSGEQELPAFAAAIESLGHQKTSPTRADLLAWLNERKMDFPIVRDDGAISSLSQLLADTDPATPFIVQPDIQARLAPHIAAIAAEMKLPRDPVQMTPPQQQAVLDRLDGYVRSHDLQLWRTKQINDFAGGIWAQIYGPVYNDLLVPFLVIHRVSEFVLIISLAIIAWRLGRPLRRRSRRRQGRRRAFGRLASFVVVRENASQRAPEKLG